MMNFTHLSAESDDEMMQIYNNRDIKFSLIIDRKSFYEMTLEIEFHRTREAGTKKRKYIKFKSNWKAFFNEKIWEQTKLKCGINYKFHNLSISGTSGSLRFI